MALVRMFAASSPPLPAWADSARMVVVAACALALICAGQTLPL